MTNFDLHCELLSDTTFGAGKGQAGGVDLDVRHDNLGLPFVHGRTLKGLLSASCAELLSALRLASSQQYDALQDAATWLFGMPGSTTGANAGLHIGHAQLPADLRAVLEHHKMAPTVVLAALTSVRRQTSVDAASGAAKDHALRSMRVINRGLLLVASIGSTRDLAPTELGILSACVSITRNAGIHRSRGLGRIRLTLHEHDSALAIAGPAQSVLFGATP